jgi:hypothetical protein
MYHNKISIARFHRVGVIMAFRARYSAIAEYRDLRGLGSMTSLAGHIIVYRVDIMIDFMAVQAVSAPSGVLFHTVCLGNEFLPGKMAALAYILS